MNRSGNWKQESYFKGRTKDGRWPANVGFDEASARMLAEQAGLRRSGNRKAGVRKGMGYHGAKGDGGPALSDSRGGASRFFFCAKASKRQRNEGLPEGVKNLHSTVKLVALMEYLCRLTMTPTGGVVLDLFMGSGTTGVAASRVGRPFIGIDSLPRRSHPPQFVPTIRQALDHCTARDRMGTRQTADVSLPGHRPSGE